MTDYDDVIKVRVREALDASAEALPLGIASRLAAARTEAIATRGWSRFALPMRWMALASVAVLTVAVLLSLPERQSPGDQDVIVALGGPASPGREAHAVAGLDFVEAEVSELEIAMEMELMEDLEFVAWLALENPAELQLNAG